MENMVKRCHLGEVPTYCDEAAIVETTSGVLQNCTSGTFRVRQLIFSGKETPVTNTKWQPVLTLSLYPLIIWQLDSSTGTDPGEGERDG